MPADPARVQEVFLAALDLPDEAARSAYLEEACAGDMDLRSRVEGLLRAHHQPDSLLDAPIVPAPADAIPAPEPPFGFELGDEIGRGAMGVVFRARQYGLNRVVAVKMALGVQRLARDSLARILAEAEAVAAIDHPHVVRVYGFGQRAGVPYLAMEYLPGGTLADRLRAGSLPPRAAAELIGKVASGVAAAHELGIVHRDLKPGNVLLDESGEPKVTDFGLARRGTGSDLTATHAVMGTPAYMAPELARGGGKFVGPTADVWALGVILYESIAGRRPFDGDSDDALHAQIQSADSPSLRSRIRSVPRDLDTIVAKCLAKAPERRYPTASELADDLSRFLRGEPITARPVGRVERAYRWARRKPTVAALYAVTCVAAALIGVAVVVASLWRDAESARGQLADEKTRVEEARQQAETAAEKLARFEYGRTMQIAHEEWRRGNIDSAAGMLLETRPDLRGWEWHYAYRLCNGLLPLRGHADSIHTAKWSANGKRVLTAGDRMDKTVRVWDADTGREVCVIRLPKPDWHTFLGDDPESRRYAARMTEIYDHFTSASFNSDGSRVLTSNVHGKQPRWWDAATGAELGRGSSPAGGLSPDGKRYIALGQPEGAVVICDTDTDAELFTLKHKSTVGRILWSPDGTQILSATQYGREAQLWDGKTGAAIAVLPTRAGAVESLSFSPDGTRILILAEGLKSEQINGKEVASPVPDKRIALIRDAKSGAEIATLSRDDVFHAFWSPDGTRLVTFDRSHSGVRIWNAATGMLSLTLKEASGYDVKGYASWSPDGTRILTSDYPVSRVWDALSGKLLRSLTHSAHREDDKWPSYASSSWSPDGKRILTLSPDHTVRLCDPETGAELAVFKHGDRILSLSWSPGGTRLLTACRDRIARIWNAGGATEVATLEQKNDMRLAVLSPDGNRVVTVQGNDGVKLLDSRAATELAIPKCSGQVESIWWSANGARVVTAEAFMGEWFARPGVVGGRTVERDRMTVRIWDGRTGANLALVDSLSKLQLAAFSPDGTRLLTLSDDAGPGGIVRARLWDAATGARIAVFDRHTRGVLSASWSADGTRVVTTSRDNSARVWDGKTGAEVIALNHTSGFNLATLSQDGARLLTASYDHTPRVWDANTGTESFALAGHTDLINAASWNADGTRIVTASADRTARVWDATTGKEVAVLRGHTGSVGSVVWSPDGTRIVTAGEDQSIRIWDAKTGAEVLVLKRDNHPVRRVWWSSDGSRIIGVSERQSWIWDATLPNPILLPKELAPMPRAM